MLESEKWALPTRWHNNVDYFYGQCPETQWFRPIKIISKFRIKYNDESYNAACYNTVVVICALCNDDAFTSDYMLSSDWLISNN
jgi:hypothetical protein